MLTHEEVIDELQQREGFIEAVSITGGEPLLYSGILSFLKSIKSETGLSVKLDTNGTQPQTLKKVLLYLDYVAMDLKSSPSKYMKATGEKALFQDVRESIEIIRSLPSYEFRTTMVPGIVDSEDVIELLQQTGRIKRYVLQTFHSSKTLSSEFTDVSAYPRSYLEDLAGTVRNMDLAEEVVIRL